MSNFDQYKTVMREYLHSAQTFILHPYLYFQQNRIEPNYRQDLILPLPAILVFCLAWAAIHGQVWLIPAGLLASYVGLGLWVVILKYTLLLFAERRSFEEVLPIVSRAAVAFIFAWIPLIGFPLLYILTGFWTFHGLVSTFAMHRGAAMATVALPVVMSGLLSSLFGFIFIWLASLTTIIPN